MITNGDYSVVSRVFIVYELELFSSLPRKCNVWFLVPGSFKYWEIQ